MKILNKYTAVIKDYPTEIQVSAKKRATYWYVGDDVPKKYNDKTKFDFSKDGVLMDLVSCEKVVKNSKTAGLPRMLTINAQKIYVGIHHSVRSKIVESLHSIFYEEFKKQFPASIDTKDKKILIGLHFYDIYSRKLPDLDNLANLFVKCGIDCLTSVNNPNQSKMSGYTHKLGIIPDDSLLYVSHILYEYTSVKEVKDRKLEFSIYQVSEDFTVESLINKEIQDGKINQQVQ